VGHFTRKPKYLFLAWIQNLYKFLLSDRSLIFLIVPKYYANAPQFFFFRIYDIYIYIYLTAIGLTPGGSNIVTYCIHMTSCGARNVFVLINIKLYLYGNYFCHQLCKSRELVRRDHSSFSIQLYPIKFANVTNCCNTTVTSMVVMQSDVRKLNPLCLECIC
jgi:hypothetical protein